VALQEQLDTLMLSADDADLYDFDTNGELRLSPPFILTESFSV